MNKKKIKILEYFILLIIISAIIIIFFVLTKAINSNPDSSNTNEVKNYSITKYYKYNLPISNSKIYNIPFYDLIDDQSSQFTTYLTATDDYIVTLEEKIKLNYIEVPQNEKYKITNFCNSYDDIEYNFIIQCSINGDYMNISNIYYINKIYTEKIKTDSIEIKLPVNKNMKASNYLKTLEEKMIFYEQISAIK